ncbi:MAG: zinc ribbon domain-containing protein [Candidatus Altiarchaeota archaeon]|nr:zinc ribbon domain-containing protein [Candidatus Altiarchaeota archaeon]
MIRKILAITVGAAIYPLSFWILFLGPMMSGFVAGWIAKTKPKEGFILGVVSAFLGFLILVHALDVFNIGIITLSDVLFFWIFMLWNLFGFLLAGVGGVLGSLLSKPVEALKETKKPLKDFKEPAAEVYLVCPSCGHSNSEEDEYCKSCGTRLVG